MFDLSTRVLIVDDMMTMRKIIGKACKDIGFKNLKEAPDGRKGWEAIDSADPPFGLLLSGWNMPDVSGIDLLKRVRADSRFKTLPFILITAEKEQKQWLPR